MTIVLKIVHGKDIRRCTLGEDSLTWPTVTRRIQELLGVDASRMHVTYKDDEGDLVTIASTEELLEAVRLARGQDPPLLRLNVGKKQASPAASPPPPPRAGAAEAPADANVSSGDVESVLASVAQELPFLAPLVNRLKSRVAAARDAPPAPGAFGGPFGGPFGGRFHGQYGPFPFPNVQDPPAPRAAAGDAPPPRTAPGPGAGCHAGCHPHHTCDGCEASPIVGVRYHSLTQANYDLCEACFTKEVDAADGDGAKAAVHAKYQPVRPGQWRRGCRGGAGAGPKGARFAARFIRDVTVFDGTELGPETKFTKIWRLRNEGAVPWPKGTRLEFVGGDAMAGPASVPVPGDGMVAPGEAVDVAADLVAPKALGRYVGYWRLAGPRGGRFGQRIWVNVTVVDPSVPPAAPAAGEAAPAGPSDADHGDSHDEDAEMTPAHDAFHNIGQLFQEIAGSAAAHFADEHRAFAAASAPAAAAGPSKPAFPEATPSPTKTAEPERREGGMDEGGMDVDVAPAPAAEPAAAPSAPAPAPLSFPVEVADGRRLTISWPQGEDAHAVADRFTAEHGLPRADHADIVRFVHHAEDLVRATAKTLGGAAPAAPAASVAPNPPAPAPAAPAPAAAAPAAAAGPSKTPEAPAPEAPAPAPHADALATLRAMGYGADDELLAQVVANNNGDVSKCVHDLGQLAEWDTLLQDLEQMGFGDAARNRSALYKNKGSVKGAVRDLVEASRGAGPSS